ncbi:MAG: hypothetical protein Q9164_006771 [Protoblastenia rupestris]
MPLNINRLCYATPVDALEFLGFCLAPSVRSLFTGLDIELRYVDWPADACVAALRQLAKMPIAHLGLTVKGVYFAEAFRGRSCFVKRIAVLKNLKSFDLRLASSYGPYKIKKEIEEEMRCKLIKGYARKADIDKEGKAAKVKRSASSETDTKAHNSKKKAKKSRQTRLEGPKPHFGRGHRLQKPGIQADMDGTRERARLSLISTHDQITKYAVSLDRDLATVKIRLEDARKAAEAVDESRFEKLVNAIWLTLENQYDNVNAARLGVPKKAISFTLPKSLNDGTTSLCEDSQRSCDSMDSQYTVTSLDTQHLSQSWM